MAIRFLLKSLPSFPLESFIDWIQMNDLKLTQKTGEITIKTQTQLCLEPSERI